MALAVNAKSFVLPHNILEFRMNLGFLPALWAADGDYVLVDDVAYAIKALASTALPHAKVQFISDKQLSDAGFSSVEPWGWDMALRQRLQSNGVAAELLPTDDELRSIRGYANRRVTTDVLMSVCEGAGQKLCGNSFYASDINVVKRLTASYRNVVLKAPWSSSGRGVRYVDNELNNNAEAWAANVIKRQGGIMVEPHYNRVVDFAMEFYSEGKGVIDYRGLSVFQTENGNYAGNVIATEEAKLDMLQRYVQPQTLYDVRQRLVRFFSNAFKHFYLGCFGVDMMIVADQASGLFKVHPCVEINLRRTMGHVANSFKATPADPVRLMRITKDVNYTLRLTTPDPGFVKVY